MNCLLFMKKIFVEAIYTEVNGDFNKSDREGWHHRWKRRQMWKVIDVFILYLFLSALLRLESKPKASFIEVGLSRGYSYTQWTLRKPLENPWGVGLSHYVSTTLIVYETGHNGCGMCCGNVRTRKIPLITLASLHAATISLDSSLKRAERNKYKMKTTITFHICVLFLSMDDVNFIVISTITVNVNFLMLNLALASARLSNTKCQGSSAMQEIYLEIVESKKDYSVANELYKASTFNGLTKICSHTSTYILLLYFV
jgi:hypothetical protein